MSSDSRQERERLKEEYKAHYRKIREAKERLSQAKRKQNITQALKEMDKSQMLESFDNFLHSVKHKLASVEARLDVAIHNISPEESQSETEQDLDDKMNRIKAKDTLRQLKMEMGFLYEEIEQQAGSIQVEKTIGSEKEQATDPEDLPKHNDQPSQNE